MIQKIILIIINLIFGSLVLFSYYNGITKEPQLSAKLWGGVPSTLQPIIICFMFISAIGYLIFTYNFLINADANSILFLNKFNYYHLHLLYLLVLIPSMLWMNSTFKYMNSGSSLDWVIIVAMLFCVAIASIVLLLFTIDMKIEENSFIYLASVIGATIFAFHTLFLDAIIWTVFFNRA